MPKPAPPREDDPQAVEEKFRLLVAGVRDYGIFLLDREGRVTSWNEGAERIKGYRADEIIGRHFSTFYPAEAVARGWPDHELKMAQSVGRFEDEGWRVRKDGTQFWANVVITAIRDERGQLIGFSKVTRDLTERRRHEEELRESEERFRLMVEAVQDYAIFMLDPEGRVASWNAGAERIKGYRPEEIIGQHFSRFYTPEKIAQRWPERELELARANGRLEDEGWRVRKDGSRFWANVVITPMYGADGRLRGYAKVTRDLTESKRVETLEEEGRRTAEFLAMLGHELRSPLAPIRNAVAILGMEHAEEKTIRWARELIERQVGHVGRLVDDLLDVSRITSGKITLRRERADLGAIVSSTLEATRPSFEKRGQAIEIDIAEAPVVVDGDPTRLAQIAVNLLNNAAKYTPDAGHVWVRVAREKQEAVLSVRDDGIGMNPELVPRVFDLFTQGERGLDRSEGGLGIGLTLVARLVALHGGRVRAHSAGLGLGSEFVVWLPAAKASAEGPSPAAADPAPAPAPTRRLRILVVDDNRDATETAAILFRLWGYDVATALDGAAALAAVAREEPDVVLLDIGLPGIDGYEVARRIRAGGTKAPVLVAMTGYGQVEDQQRSSEAGFDRHLVKPVDPDALKRLVTEIEASLPR